MHKLRRFLLLGLTICSLCLTSMSVVFAEDTLDGIFGNDTSSTVTEQPEQSQDSGGSATPPESKISGSEKSGFGDALKGVTEGIMQKDNVDKAVKIASPLVKPISFLIVLVLVVLTAILSFITLIDIVALTVPPIRKELCGGVDPSNDMQTNGQQGNMGAGNTGFGMQAGGMGGMGGMGGYGGRSGYGGRGGMGMGMGMGMGGQGVQQDGGVTVLVRRWVSDEAMAALREVYDPMTGKAKNVLRIYGIKRAIFLFFYGLSTVLLFCSIFFDFGITVAEKLLGLVG